jgi:hypothetical protein
MPGISKHVEQIMCCFAGALLLIGVCICSINLWQYLNRAIAKANDSNMLPRFEVALAALHGRLQHVRADQIAQTLQSNQVPVSPAKFDAFVFKLDFRTSTDFDLNYMDSPTRISMSLPECVLIRC